MDPVTRNFYIFGSTLVVWFTTANIIKMRCKDAVVNGCPYRIDRQYNRQDDGRWVYNYRNSDISRTDGKKATMKAIDEIIAECDEIVQRMDTAENRARAEVWAIHELEGKLADQRNSLEEAIREIDAKLVELEEEKGRAVAALQSIS